MSIMKTYLVITLLLLAGSTSFAQQPGNPTSQSGVMPPRGTFVIRNARIVTVSGAEIENGTVVIREGKIAAVGSNVGVPANAADHRRQWFFNLSWNDRCRHFDGPR